MAIKSIKASLSLIHYSAGRSMGAQVAAALACEPDMSDFISGCIFLSYPLYCPSKPLALRKEHLLPLAVPSLFLSGDSDEMCDKNVLTEVAAKMATQPAIYWVASANHGMSVKGRKRIDIEEEMCGCVVKWVTKEFRRLSKRSVEESRDPVGAAPSVENSPIKLAFKRARKCKKHPRQKSSEEASKKHRNT
ncbi:testis-expressed protein 30-like [Corticium candelabrum]|uniref:testis-expressed protein 30-like n=1 Tax=Corticium candelabrum TaxID=121492 RepID=UPI002E25BB31|nr:testis-expressed protein 30-like [Corticium candelabrum]